MYFGPQVETVYEKIRVITQSIASFCEFGNVTLL